MSRPAFYDELKDRVRGLSMRDAILEVNHWCHEKVAYQPSDGRTSSPLATVCNALVYDFGYLMMEMRLLKISDYQSVYNLWKNTSGMGLRSLDDSEEGIKRFLLRNPNTNFVAVIDKKIAGVIMAGNDGRRGYIYHLAVQNEYRRRGIASALVKECLMALRIEEINKVALVVFSDNTSGNNFWQKLGFIEREDLVYRNISINEENI